MLEIHYTEYTYILSNRELALPSPDAAGRLSILQAKTKKVRPEIIIQKRLVLEIEHREYTYVLANRELALFSQIASWASGSGRDRSPFIRQRPTRCEGHP